VYLRPPMKRRWVDAYVIGKVGGGLALLAVSATIWFGADRFWPWGWVLGGGMLLWGLLSIGDKKSEYGDW
jgi:hypothetical protein